MSILKKGSMDEKNFGCIFKILSVLLDYPGEDYLSQIEELETAAADLPPHAFKNSIFSFMADIKSRSPVRIREIYTSAFDMSPATTMNLTYHIWGDNEKRAGMLTRLQQAYQDAGFERITRELPDYLPILLEFLSVCPEDTDIGSIWACFRNFDAYLDRLKQAAPAYSALLQPLADMAVKRIQPNEDFPAAECDRAP